MNFLKQNIFLLVVAGAALILSIALLVMGSGDSDEAESRLKERTTFIQRTLSPLLSQAKTDPVNQAKCDEAKNFVAGVEKELVDVRKISVGWNSRYYKILQMAHKDIVGRDGKKGGEFNAFPVDQKVYMDYGLWGYFTEQYIEAKDALHNRLEAIAVNGTTEQIEDRVKYWEEALVHNWRVDPARTNEERIAGPPLEENTKFASYARDLAQQEITRKSARSGNLYMSSNALDVVFSSERYEAIDLAEMKKSQINLWVQGDIISAITKTIDDEFARLKPEFDKINAQRKVQAEKGEGQAWEAVKPCVIYSPIKKLVKIIVGMEEKNPKTLTGRVSGGIYSIVPYSFSVVMPLRFADELEENLVSCNYHTITNLTVSSVVAPKEAMFYLGWEPVVQIKFEGQLILLSEWMLKYWPKK